jgi:hypothetical protein
MEKLIENITRFIKGDFKYYVDASYLEIGEITNEVSAQLCRSKMGNLYLMYINRNKHTLYLTETKEQAEAKLKKMVERLIKHINGVIKEIEEGTKEITEFDYGLDYFQFLIEKSEQHNLKLQYDLLEIYNKKVKYKELEKLKEYKEDYEYYKKRYKNLKNQIKENK